MASERQMQANRLNAQKSTGPRTENGKLAVHHNALTHGLLSRDLLSRTRTQGSIESCANAFAPGYSPRVSWRNYLPIA